MALYVVHVASRNGARHGAADAAVRHGFDRATREPKERRRRILGRDTDAPPDLDAFGEECPDETGGEVRGTMVSSAAHELCAS